MEKNNRWHIALVSIVLLLTAYNILPTIFYYSQDLSKPVSEKGAQSIVVEATHSIEQLPQKTNAWLYSFCSLLSIEPSEIVSDVKDNSIVSLKFKTENDALVFKKYIQNAGQSIPSPFERLNLVPFASQSPLEVKVHRPSQSFKDAISARYIPKEEDSKLSPLFLEALGEKCDNFLSAISTKNSLSELATQILSSQENISLRNALAFSEELSLLTQTFNKQSKIRQNYIASIFQSDNISPTAFYKAVTDKIDSSILKLQRARIDAGNEENPDASRIETYKTYETSLSKCQAELASNKEMYTKRKKESQTQPSELTLKESSDSSTPITIAVFPDHPLIQKVAVDLSTLEIVMIPTSSVAKILDSTSVESEKQKQFINQAIAYMAGLSGLNLDQPNATFSFQLFQNENMTGLLSVSKKPLVEKKIESTLSFLTSSFAESIDDCDSYTLSFGKENEIDGADKKDGAVFVGSPEATKILPLQRLPKNSVFIIAKGMKKKIHSLSKADSEKNEGLLTFISQYVDLLSSIGFKSVDTSAIDPSNDLSDDIVFVNNSFAVSTLSATGYPFFHSNNQNNSFLELSSVKEMMANQNRLEDSRQQKLLKWKEEYQLSQIEPSKAAQFKIPQPTENTYFENLKLSLRKYFRGDASNVLKWGLDLSGGKTVRIELVDSNNVQVTDDADIEQGMSELYTRVNSLGVSEVAIRKEGNYITLDFPGSQNISAKELVTSSSMSFHVINEKFASTTSPLNAAANKFLQSVWNRAQSKKTTTPHDIRLIAYDMLYGSTSQLPAGVESDIADLIANGLVLADPQFSDTSSTFNDVESSISVYSGDSFSDWNFQTHPLTFVFSNYALTGADLSNIQAGYDQKDGNYLAFQVRSPYASKNKGIVSPQVSFREWTEVYSKDGIENTELATFTDGKGWRMAAILNGKIVSAPALSSTLEDAARISGTFTQQDINALEADLKAGALTYTPKILSEKNVSPELGASERNKGVSATIIALFLVFVVMIIYYRFSGVVASIALVLNLLIMWAILQNLSAAITLPGLAGIILTLGMAVDANVLVFERIREEISSHGKIGLAIANGYKKAFSAIFDSNVTTILAALILFNFDSGPVKGFAITLIVGIVSSMFTALFATRVYFKHWLKRTNGKKTLTMMSIISSTSIKFVQKGKYITIFSLVVAVIGTSYTYSISDKILGMDFTGGNAITLSIENYPDNVSSPKIAIENSLEKAGLESNEFSVRELDSSNDVRIFLKNIKHTSYFELENKQQTYSYEGSDDISWVVTTLKNGGVTLSPSSLESLHLNWTSISGQMSETMVKNSYIALAIAFAAILIYIAIRFEVIFALAATLGLAFDIALAIAALGIAHIAGFTIQVDLTTVAALMTLVGYSLNDTIIVFDRVREESLGKERSMTAIVNTALNATLGRTIMTSTTTFVVLLALLAFGGQSIFTFAFIMAVGVVVGTLSTLFIASFILCLFDKCISKKAIK